MMSVFVVFGHDQLSTYGLGKDLPQTQWRSLFRQLITHAYLQVDVENYGALRLTEKSRVLLRGEESLQLRKQTKAKKAQKKVARSQSINKADQPLWEALKHLRANLAQEQSVRPMSFFMMPRCNK